jgi:glycosyltransferase involved in cell wall biosynthesis
LWRANGREFQRVTRLVCVSECTANDTLREFACRPEFARVVLLPLRPGLANRAHAQSNATRNTGVVLHVGNNGFYKNREAVLRLFAGLDRDIASRLVLAGQGPTIALQRLAHELAISDRIEWVLDPDDDTLASYYRTASVLLHPSLYEGFGWPVLEAMAFGLPVVVSDAGSLREVVGAAGVCLPLNDESGFVSAITRILSVPEDAAALSRRGLERARDFHVSEFARQMREVYAGVIAESRGGSA